MAHTEGPWIACRPGESEWSPHYWEIEDPYGHTATVYGDDDEAAHNAHLIAAAPEMFRLLRECSSALADCLSELDPSGMECQEQWACVAECKAIIAKAEGRGG